jgi:hypothetical protein
MNFYNKLSSGDMALSEEHGLVRVQFIEVRENKKFTTCEAISINPDERIVFDAIDGELSQHNLKVSVNWVREREAVDVSELISLKINACEIQDGNTPDCVLCGIASGKASLEANNLKQGDFEYVLFGINKKGSNVRLHHSATLEEVKSKGNEILNLFTHLKDLDIY